MLYGLYLSTAGLKAQEYRNSVIANNLANSQTTGFKRDIAMVAPRANAAYEDPRMFGYRMPVLSDLGGGVTWGPSVLDLSQGSLQSTGSQSDVALTGHGFFMLASKGKTPRLTRDGSFLVRSDGVLVTAADGTPVLGANHQTIKVNPAVHMQIDGTGAISQGSVKVGQLALVNVRNPQDLKQLGGNVYSVASEKTLTAAPASTQVRQGFLEASAVNPTVEMVNMIAAQRTFDANAQMIKYQNHMLQQLDAVGQVA